MLKTGKILVFLALFVTSAHAQQADSLVRAMAEERDFFSLRDFFASHRCQLSKTERKHTRQLLREAFNRDKRVRKQRQGDLRRAKGTVDVPFRLDSIGNGVVMMVPIQFREQAMPAQFDTGATVNVVTEQTARRLGLRPSGGRITFVGESQHQMMALTMTADTLQVGNVTLYNVPFQQTDLPVMDHQQVILGLPVIMALGAVDIDMRTRHIRTLTDPITSGTPANLCFALPSHSLLLQAFHESDTLRILPDMGTTDTALGPEHSRYGSLATETQQTTYRGVGGDVTVTEGIIRHFALRVGGMRYTIPHLSVTPHPRFESRLGMDFFSRCDRVQLDWQHMVMRTF